MRKQTGAFGNPRESLTFGIQKKLTNRLLICVRRRGAQSAQTAPHRLYSPSPLAHHSYARVLVTGRHCSSALAMALQSTALLSSHALSDISDQPESVRIDTILLQNSASCIRLHSRFSDSRQNKRAPIIHLPSHFALCESSFSIFQATILLRSSPL